MLPMILTGRGPRAAAGGGKGRHAAILKPPSVHFRPALDLHPIDGKPLRRFNPLKAQARDMPMATIFIARSANVSQWGSDVGLGKNLFKVGVTDGDPAALVAEGWAGERDWTLVKQQADVDVTQAEVEERLARRQKRVDPTYYPRIKGETALFKVVDADVQRHMVLARAMAGESERTPIRLKAADYAAYLLSNALR